MHFDSFFRDNVINGYCYVISCFMLFISPIISPIYALIFFITVNSNYRFI